MIHVSGRMMTGSLEFLQDQACTNWLSHDFPARCASYSEEKWKALSASLPRKGMDFCIDKYEFPNAEGAYPVIMMTWYEAKDACAAEGKRLCSDEEWTFACEGEEGLPYPYGYDRDSGKCNIDHGWIQWDAEKLAHRSSTDCAAELDRLWQGVPSGSMDCRSPFGVYDLTGNIDEWTVNRISGGHYKGAQKGGYWAEVRDRCRPATIAHSEEHMFYQQGTRCCSDR